MVKLRKNRHLEQALYAAEERTAGFAPSVFLFTGVDSYPQWVLYSI